MSTPARPYLTDQSPDDLRSQARTYRELAAEFEQKAFDKQRQQLTKLQREGNDKLINKKEAIGLLWFDTYESLKNWQKKVGPLGYLRFENKKILRSEVLRFRDDYYNGKIHQKRAEAGQ